MYLNASMFLKFLETSMFYADHRCCCLIIIAYSHSWWFFVSATKYTFSDFFSIERYGKKSLQLASAESTRKKIQFFLRVSLIFTLDVKRKLLLLQD